MARPRLGESESKRLQMVITEDELEAIDSWRFANRVPSKSEAIRRLVQIGLIYDAHAEPIAEGMKNLFEEATRARAPRLGPPAEPTGSGHIAEASSGIIGAIFALQYEIQQVFHPVKELRQTGSLQSTMQAANRVRDEMKRRADVKRSRSPLPDPKEDNR